MGWGAIPLIMQHLEVSRGDVLSAGDQSLLLTVPLSRLLRHPHREYCQLIKRCLVNPHFLPGNSE